jgi:predicted nuclease of restriction endonuclease-like (RecB) superfamily
MEKERTFVQMRIIIFFSSFFTIYQKVEILKDQPTFQQFITPEEFIMMPKVFEYLLLHRSKELENLRHQIGALSL